MFYFCFRTFPFRLHCSLISSKSCVSDSFSPVPFFRLSVLRLLIRIFCHHSVRLLPTSGHPFPSSWIFRCAFRHDSWLLRLELTFLPVGPWIPLARPLFNLLIVGYGASTFSVPLARFVRSDASAFMAKSTICKSTVPDKDSVPPSMIRALLQCHQPRIHQSVPLHPCSDSVPVHVNPSAFGPLFFCFRMFFMLRCFPHLPTRLSRPQGFGLKGGDSAMNFLLL